MDISQAKEQIKQCVQIYLSKDGFGAYNMPIERQRPVFLLGAPGIGKTAIMEQIANELSLPLVSYSMTHHTRQSALGLPTIEQRVYQGKPMSITEYTLSEIIVALYETMERTDSKEGILFLDEINCVSETLAPTMLQFLQYKTFGNHRIPEGWVVVTAGNPPQFNRSVREFDIVTLDRLKVMNIEPDYDAWDRYAKAKGLHQAVQGYLDLHKEDFYILENTKNGKQYVTARGWEDLSEAIAQYEEKDFEVDESLVGQYLRHDRICMDFTAYYRLYRKYRNDYGIRAVLDGSPMEASARFKKADIDEKITVTKLFAEAVIAKLGAVQEQTDGIHLIQSVLKTIKEQALPGRPAVSSEIFQKLENAQLLHEHDPHGGKYLTAFCKAAMQKKSLSRGDISFDQVAEIYKEWVALLQADITACSNELENAFLFFEEAGSSNEMLLFLTELTVNEKSSRFLFEHPSDGYMRNSSLLALGERKQELLKKAEELNL